MDWVRYRFADLGVENLYDALALRCRVFIMEQGAYLDTDGVDRVSWHLLGRDEAGVLQAYCRLVDPGVKYEEASMGRVITSPETRGTGLGRELVAQALKLHTSVWPGLGNRISAQARLERFYGEFGWRRAAPDHIEDGIPHTVMLWTP